MQEEQVLVVEGVDTRSTEQSTWKEKMSLWAETASEGDRHSAAGMNLDQEEDTETGMMGMQEVEARGRDLLREASMDIRKVLVIGMVNRVSGHGMVEMNMEAVARVGMDSESYGGRGDYDQREAYSRN